MNYNKYIYMNIKLKYLIENGFNSNKILNYFYEISFKICTYCPSLFFKDKS